MKSLITITDIIHQWTDLRNTINNIFEKEDTAQIEGTYGCLFSYFIKEFCKIGHLKSLHATQYSSSSKKTPEYSIISSDLLIVVPTESEVNNIANDLNTIYPDANVFIFPTWGTVPYRPAARGSAVFGKRAGVLSKILEKDNTISMKEKPRIFIFTQRSFMSPLPNPSYIKEHSFKLRKGETIDTIKIAEKLTALGYIRVPKVSVRGEFSLRGEVIDIFLPYAENATRIIFDFGEIESFKSFDTDSQSTIEKLGNDIVIGPMKEILWDDESINTLKEKLKLYQDSAINDEDNYEINENNASMPVHLSFSENALKYQENLLFNLELSHEAEGEEFYYQLLWDKQYTILDYFDPSSFVLFYNFDKLDISQQVIKREYEKLYRTTRDEYPVLPLDYTLIDFNKLVSLPKKSIKFRSILRDEENKDSIIKIDAEPPRSFFGNINFLKEELEKFQQDGWKIFIYADNENQELRIHSLLKDFIEIDNKPQTVNPLVLIPESVSEGFSIPSLKIMVIQENEIFGRRKYVAKVTSKAKSKAIDTFVELSEGDYVVHVNWGIGKYHGIERLKTLGNEKDYIKLEYADNEMAFVPIEQVNLIQRYIGNEGNNPRLDTIGSKSWEKRTSKVKKAVEDLAQKLIDLYSRRQSSVGYAFPKETEWQAAFEAAFPYEDTPDQITVTEEIKEDMEKPIPMDRLVCGDVGYGKTEVAMRAAFKAVMGGKQVAFLAPTTILAEQHYESCKKRFKNFPVKIERLSRFVTPKEQKNILKRLSEGDVDILVGTHRIIQKDVIFKNIGLLIIDEEQRFGVKDKEKLKTIKNNIDCLTMSATPIPRTLHMSLLKIRDMSLLTTPPQSRQPIETVIDEYTDDRIIQAIRREIDRGGQVFYLHNRVESLMEIRHKIEKLVPEVIVEVAHGQMSSSQLEDIFQRFKNGGFHVLIATTIIENGIDIPNVNTIIIDRADMYGVSQLYQLRGRVGRSDRQAYAYLLYPENKVLSEIAMKRLQVISDFTELGSGFKIAMKDMEIRGAGNLLGKDQSGDVYSVGFDMYVRLLNDAVNRLTDSKDYEEQIEVVMELEYSGFIPDSYIPNPQIKMEIYKKIASITTDIELNNVVSELSDRFGPIPDEVSSLLALAEIRIICKKLSISTLKEKMGEVKVEFGQVSKISIDKIMKLIKENPGTVRLDQKMPNAIFIKLGKIGLKEKSEFIREKLSKLV